MGKRFTNGVFRIIRFFIKLFYPKVTFEGTDNLPDGPAVVVGNHCKMNAPIACELYFPGEHYTWTAGEMMQLREVPDYAYQDFWSYKPGYIKWLYRLLSYLIAPLSVCIFNNAKCIGVYHDTRIMSTFRTTVARLQEGARVIILPEHYTAHNNIVWEFQNRFVDTARMYYRKTKEPLSFVPMYTAPALKKVYLGRPIQFDPSAPIEEERKRIADYLMDEITRIAKSLPEHTVVPYPNMPKSQYPLNTEAEGSRDLSQYERK